jgi:regulatory protein
MSSLLQPGETEAGVGADSDPDFEGDRSAYQAALDSAVRSLGRREHGRRELEQKLLHKGHAPALVTRVLDVLAADNLQSDARYVEEYIRSRIRRGYGPIKIRQELSSRGIQESELEDELTESAEFWIKLAGDGLDRKFGGPPSDRDGWNRQARFLARRGFPSDLIYRVLGSHSD